jgi:hypothetical protein
MKKIIIMIAIIGLCFLGCTNSKGAKQLLEDEGFTDITITGYDFLACSKDDFYHTGFIAKKNGKERRGTVCEGLFFKGSTIRFK